MIDGFGVADLGTCCVCRGTENVRNIFLLNRRGPVPGEGWGCAQCGLPPDGAVAILCDSCTEAGCDPLEVCDGYASSRGRIALSDLPASVHPFEHDPAKHHELTGVVISDPEAVFLNKTFPPEFDASDPCVGVILGTLAELTMGSNSLESAWLGFGLAYDMMRLDSSVLREIGDRDGWNDDGVQELIDRMKEVRRETRGGGQ